LDGLAFAAFYFRVSTSGSLSSFTSLRSPPCAFQVHFLGGFITPEGLHSSCFPPMHFFLNSLFSLNHLEIILSSLTPVSSFTTSFFFRHPPTPSFQSILWFMARQGSSLPSPFFFFKRQPTRYTLNVFYWAYPFLSNSVGPVVYHISSFLLFPTTGGVFFL